jgi:DNA-binding FadR family transcriptional regulator
LQSVRVKPISRTSAADAVRDQLIALIEAGDLDVGAKLPSEHELARSFGVSRAVIREALGSVRSIGMVESRAGSGTYVRSARATRGGLLLAGKYTTDELHEVRRHIEIPGAALAARRRSDDDVRRLEEIVERHAQPEDAVAWVRDDLLFHVTLAEATGNTLQIRFVMELRELQSELTLTMARMAGGLAAPVEEHGAVLEAVRAQDEDAARRAMTAHLDAIQGRSELIDS